MRNSKVTFMVQAAMIAAIYVVLVELFAPISFGPIQFRVAEALTVLPFFIPAAIPGLSIGCLLGNMLGGAILADIVFGSLATFLGAIGTYCVGRVWSKNSLKFLAVLPPILSNTIIVPWVLKYGYGMEDSIPLMMVTVGAGEIIICGIVGAILLVVLEKYRHVIFKDVEATN